MGQGTYTGEQGRFPHSVQEVRRERKGEVPNIPFRDKPLVTFYFESLLRKIPPSVSGIITWRPSCNSDRPVS